MEAAPILADARRAIYSAPVEEIAKLTALLRQLRTRPEGEVSRELAQTLELLSIGRRLMGDFKSGLRDSQESRELYAGLGDDAGVAKACILTGNLHFCLGDYEPALVAFNEGLDMRRKLGDHKGEAGALGSIGAVFDEMKHWKEARRCYLESLDISRGLGDRMFEARTLNNLGETNLNLGNRKVAADLCAAALVIFQELGETVEQVNVHNNLGRIAHADHRYEAAKMAFERAQTSAHALGLHLAEAVTRFFMAGLLADENSPFYSLPAAIRELEELLNVAVELDVQALAADIKTKLSELRNRAG
ncbi:MAG: tetratricopeptide repeat protein [Cephaloticoccus sp.]|nr:tetratricopeptide repeat protein [Cephaloticoccus sp.]